MAIRLEWECSRHPSHSDEERGADVNRRRCRSIGFSGNNCRNDTHNAVARDGNAVSSATVSARQYLRGVGIERSVINVDAECNETGEDEILHRCFDCRIREKEGHGDKGPDDHSILAAKLGIAHIAGYNRSGNAADVR